VRLAEGRLTGDERRLFNAWLAVPGNSETFDDAVRVWRIAESAAGRPEVINARSEALDQLRRANSRRWLRSVSRRWSWGAGLAAAIALVLLGSLFLMRNPARIYETGVGERQVAMLDDGSRLSLDAATEVEVRMVDDRRQLRLVSGRAKFDVAKDPLRPFIVAVGDKLVVATGTSFSVELLNNQVHVLLYEGHVEVLQNSGVGTSRRPLRIERTSAQGHLALTPGRELVAPLAAVTATVEPVDVPRSLSWETGQLNFENEPLSSAVARFNRYTREKLAVGGAVSGIRIDGVFDAGNTEAFVEGVTALHPVRVVRANGRITFRRR
jgi:transmembrane sensor